MAKVIWEGWQTDLRDVAQPTGPVVKRDGKAVIAITLPADDQGSGLGVRGSLASALLEVCNGPLACRCKLGLTPA